MKTKWLWGSILLWLMACTLAGCGTVIPGNSPPARIGYPGNVLVTPYSSPNASSNSSAMLVRILVQTRNTLGTLRSLKLDPDADGPQAAEELEFEPFDISVVPGNPQGFSGWVCEYEFPLEGEVLVTFFLECASRTLDVSYGWRALDPWPY